MQAEKRPGVRGSESEGRPRCRPRVVIFDVAGTAVVEVVDLPESANLGHRICHRGRDWLITGVRTGDRVLIAEPAAN
jgi:hypothetical protein